MSICPKLASTDPGLDRWLNRRPVNEPELVATVSEIVQRVAEEGESALLEYARKFDSPDLQSLFVSPEEIASADLPTEHAEAVLKAIDRVREFHEVQLSVLTAEWETIGDSYGWRTAATSHPESGFEGQRMLPLSRVGVYVPGGRATYPSSVIMNAVPAQVAGVKEIVVSTPADPDGAISNAVLFTCRELGIETILKAGGAGAVAALAFGLPSLPRVDKVVGPGNRYVNEAKRQVWGAVGLDSYAGPSEVCIVVDETANPAWAAADFICQLEHAPDNVGMIIATDAVILDATLLEVDSQIMRAERSAVIRRAVSEQSCAVLAHDEEDIVRIVDAFAPEHLSIMTAEPGGLAMRIRNAGCILLGHYTPQSAGDFCSGPSHTLPTSGAGRFASPINVQDFLKICSISMLEQVDLQDLTSTIAAFGQIEGFPAHAAGATIRNLSE